MRKITAGNPTVAIGYTRTSTDAQDLSHEAQRRAITQWAASRGVTIAAWHEDRVSGGTPVEDRRGLMAALGDLRERRAGLLLASRRDRLARDTVIAAMVERLAQTAGARVATTDGLTMEDTAEAGLMKAIVDAFAAYERALIRSRTRAALSVKKARGERVSGRAPLGYRFEGGMLVPDLDEAAALQRARELRSRRLSVARIASILNAEGVKCRGGRWHVTSLRRALAKAA